jgi:class 3 adenylate cyclase
MSELRVWLQQLGLEKYCETLEIHDVDLSVAPDLGDLDLEKLGFSLGHRRKFLAAAAKLRAAPPAPPTQPAPAPQRRQVERRQVTVVFADLVGSTALASQLDPEDMGKLLRGYREACAAAIARYDGHIAQYLGDGILAYFGYPRAQEDAAERAVRAALEIVREIAHQSRPDGRPLEARAGIATGLVATSEMAGAGADGEQTVIGATPNLAARLQALAEPGVVLVSPPTHRLTRNFFEYLFVGEHALKGYDEPVAVWRALGEAAVESRFVATRAATTEPIVGRERELVLLSDAWERAVRGHGHLVLLSGEAGIGKSRLIESFAEQIQERSHRLLRCQCSPHHRNSALHPITQLMRRRIDLRGDVAAAENLRRIDDLLARIGRPGRVPRLLLASLLDVPAPDEISPMEMTPAQRKNETLAILEDFLFAPLDGEAVLLLIEDAHWSDPTTRALIDRLLKRVGRARALVLVTQRPELQTDWAAHPDASLVTCKPLARELCAELIRRVTAAARMDEAVVGEIVARSDGVPLFVEEIAKAVVDLRSTRPTNVPLTLQDSLAARLDHLGKAKEIAQVASVIGRQFPRALLAAVSGEGEAALDEALERLRASGLVFGIDNEEGGGYCFNHSLVQEAAYESLARDRRLALHAGIARLLESAEGESEPAVIAHHYGRAGDAHKAAEHWLRAAREAASRVAFPEAIASLASALEEAARISDAGQRAQMTLALQLKLSQVHVSRSGPGNDSARAALDEAYRIAKSGPPSPQLFQATWGLYIDAVAKFESVRGRMLGEELVALSRALDDEDLGYEALHHHWGMAYFAGNVDDLLERSRQGMQRYDRTRHHALSDVYAGHDPGVCAHCCQSFALALSGRAGNAYAAFGDALALAESLPHPVTLGFALANGCHYGHMLGDWKFSADHGERLLKITERYEFLLPRAFALLVLGAIRMQSGEKTAGFGQMSAAYDMAANYRFPAGYQIILMAQALMAAGRHQDALDLVTRSLDAMQEPETGTFVAGLWRMRGEAALALSAAAGAEAERCFALSERISRSQGSRILQVGAALSLARLLADQRRTAEASAVLSQALDGFVLDYPGQDLAEARKLRVELA